MIHLVTLDFPPDFDGGIASWAEDLARALVGAERSVTVYARYTGRSQAYDDILPFPVMRMVGRSWARWQAVFVRLQVGPRIAAGDLVLFATWRLAALLAPYAKDRGARVGVFFHGSELTELRGTPWAMQRVLRFSDGLFTVSRYLAGLLKEAHGHDATVVPMALESGPRPGLVGNGGLLVVARLNRRKGVDRAIRIAHALGWPLTIVGAGPARPALEVVQIELQSTRVEFMGRKSRVRALDTYLGRTATLLLPRTHEDGRGAEGLGLALLESASRGTPTIGCRTGGVPEAAGLVLEEPDDAQGSAEAIRAWLQGGHRGAEAWSWLQAHHGPEQAVQALAGVLG